jgi:2-oxoglutarate ferredoxin oxidoreductase subunit delta
MAKFQVLFDGDVCKGCELCAAFCPKGLIAPSDVINDKGYAPASIARQEECVGCQSCALVCPDGAISVYMEEAV